MRMKMIMRCPGCGKKLEDGKFCKHCGAKVG
jgi:rRNA maturation endonuclease Nob1